MKVVAHNLSMNALESAALITLTEPAFNQVVHLKRIRNSNAKLRVYIVGGGCSGFQYGFKLDEGEQPAPDDVVIEKRVNADNVTILIDSLSFQYLVNSKIDYVVGLQGARFTVENPNAETTCGCGSSFSLKAIENADKE